MLSKKHRSIDGVDEDKFQEILHSASSRRDLLLGHIRLMAGSESGMWFEKTPQHVYAAPLIKGDFPESLLVFIFRNPLNACASLYQGRQLKVGSLAGSISYWKEAFSIYKFLAHSTDGIKLIRYEDFVGSPENVFMDLMKEVDYTNAIVSAPQNMVAKKPNERKDILSDAECEAVLEACKSEMQELAYL